MLGHRGCRLGLSFPAIYRMQVEAIITAGAQLVKEGLDVSPEIMIPLTVDVEEMHRLREDLSLVASQVQDRFDVKVHYMFGTMIETPRAALTAGEIAKESEFFSFGTNDLTQMVFGFSRDDAEGKFLRWYIEEGVLPNDPFASIDPQGVGASGDRITDCSGPRSTSSTSRTTSFRRPVAARFAFLLASGNRR